MPLSLRLLLLLPLLLLSNLSISNILLISLRLYPRQILIPPRRRPHRNPQNLVTDERF
jgi:hypothetical protein